MLLVTTLVGALAAISALQWTAFVCILLLGGYLFLARNHGKLEKLGLHSERPHLLFGNVRELYLQELSLMDFVPHLYNKKFKDHK